jgi:hypothetical protein
MFGIDDILGAIAAPLAGSTLNKFFGSIFGKGKNNQSFDPRMYFSGNSQYPLTAASNFRSNQGQNNPLGGLRIPGVGGSTKTPDILTDKSWLGSTWDWIKNNPEYSIPLGYGLVSGIAGIPESKAQLSLLQQQGKGQELQNALAAILLNRERIGAPYREKMIPEILEGRGPRQKYLNSLGERGTTLPQDILNLMQDKDGVWR